ncbi:hypothetical protein GCM10028895_46970 [Pontibacter rugosus]
MTDGGVGALLPVQVAFKIVKPRLVKGLGFTILDDIKYYDLFAKFLSIGFCLQV